MGLPRYRGPVALSAPGLRYTSFAKVVTTQMKLAEHHAVWLSVHPARTEKWLRAMLADGFDVHHLDGDDENHAPNNLILIDASDHTRVIHTLPFARLDAMFAARDRKTRIIAACSEAGIEYGAFVSKTIKGGKYWYWQDNVTHKQTYLGPDFAYMRVVIDGYNEVKAEAIRKAGV